MIGYSHLSKNFPQFVVIHIVKGFSAVNKIEVDVFLEFPFVTLNKTHHTLSSLDFCPSDGLLLTHTQVYDIFMTLSPKLLNYMSTTFPFLGRRA